MSEAEPSTVPQNNQKKNSNLYLYLKVIPVAVITFIFAIFVAFFDAFARASGAAFSLFFGDKGLFDLSTADPISFILVFVMFFTIFGLSFFIGGKSIINLFLKTVYSLLSDSSQKYLLSKYNKLKENDLWKKFVAIYKGAGFYLKRLLGVSSPVGAILKSFSVFFLMIHLCNFLTPGLLVFSVIFIFIPVLLYYMSRQGLLPRYKMAENEPKNENAEEAINAIVEKIQNKHSDVFKVFRKFRIEETEIALKGKISYWFFRYVFPVYSSFLGTFWVAGSYAMVFVFLQLNYKITIIAPFVMYAVFPALAFISVFAVEYCVDGTTCFLWTQSFFARFAARWFSKHKKNNWYKVKCEQINSNDMETYYKRSLGDNSDFTQPKELSFCGLIKSSFQEKKFSTVWAVFCGVVCSLTKGVKTCLGVYIMLHAFIFAFAAFSLSEPAIISLAVVCALCVACVCFCKKVQIFILMLSPKNKLEKFAVQSNLKTDEGRFYKIYKRLFSLPEIIASEISNTIIFDQKEISAELNNNNNIIEHSNSSSSSNGNGNPIDPP